MKTLITGATGFLGHHLIQTLLEDSPDTPLYTVGRRPFSMPGVEHTVCDLTDETQVGKLLDRIGPDEIYHLAGEASVNEKVGMARYFHTNFLTSTYIARNVQRLGLNTRLFFSSTVHVYGNQEGEIGENAPLRPANDYGFSKFIAEEMFRKQTALYEGLSVVVGRLYTCIGPGQAEGFVVSDLCKQLAEQSRETNPVLRTGPLAGFRHFIDVRDAVKLFPKLLQAPSDSRFDVYNIGSPFEIGIGHLVRRLVEVSGMKPRVESTEETAGNDFRGLHLDVSKLEQRLGGLSFRPFETTLKDCLSSAMARTS